MVGRIPVSNNLEQVRKAANAVIADLEARLPGYGAALPSATGQPDGRFFVLTTTQTLYQIQSAAWVAVDMVP